MPKISVVMALYNTPLNYLQNTVESLLDQTFKDFELIVIDDASSTDYKNFFENFNGERIKYFKLEKNAGPGHARNEGIKKATGEYIAIADSDDIYLPLRLERQAEFLDNNPDTSLISCAFRFSNKNKIQPCVTSDKEIKTFMLFNSPLSNPAIMFRREIFAQNNLFYPEDKNFAEDYELWIDAMFRSIKMDNVDECLMIYTRRAGQLSKEKQATQVAILKDLYKKILFNLGIEAAQNELDLHYNIYAQNFGEIESTEKISNWFDKIIEHNKNLKIFDEESLLNKKNEVLRQYSNVKNRLLKIKVGNYNLCLSKYLKLYLEARD